ncbi:hypothetical protein GCM10022293_22730 [Azospirillum formosense]
MSAASLPLSGAAAFRVVSDMWDVEGVRWEAERRTKKPQAAGTAAVGALARADPLTLIPDPILAEAEAPVRRPFRLRRSVPGATTSL